MVIVMKVVHLTQPLNNHVTASVVIPKAKVVSGIVWNVATIFLTILTVIKFGKKLWYLINKIMQLLRKGMKEIWMD